VRAVWNWNAIHYANWIASHLENLAVAQSRLVRSCCLLELDMSLFDKLRLMLLLMIELVLLDSSHLNR